MERFPQLTPQIISTMPWTQQLALFTEPENQFATFAEAFAYLRAQREQEEVNGSRE